MDTGIPLSGVVISSDKENTLSDNSGMFSINASEPIIWFSHLGFKPDSIQVLDTSKFVTVFLSQSIHKLNQVVVRSPLLHDKLHSMPSSIALLKKNDLNHSDNVSYIETLNNLSGVNVHKGTMNTSRITVRGMGARTPYATNRIKAYYNEIPLTSGDGTTLIEDIDPVFLQSVNLIKGAKSAMYGSGLGGILFLSGKNYFKQGISSGFTLEGGSFGTVQPSAWLNYRKNDFSLSSGYSYVHADGFRENSSYDRHNANLYLSLNMKRLEMSFLIHFINVYGQIPSSLDEDTFTKSPEKAAANWKAVKGYESYSRLISGFKSKFFFFKSFANTTIVYGSLFDAYESRPFNILDDNSAQLGLKSYFTYKNKGFSIRSGVDYMFEQYNWSIYETIEGVEGEEQNRFMETRHPLMLFVQSDLMIISKFVIEAGLSYNITKYKLSDLFIDSVNLSGKHKFSPSVSPFVGFNYSLTKRINVYTSLGHGFSLPSVEETLLPNGQINPNLKPESGINFELGGRYQSLDGNLYFDGTAYIMSVKNLLVTKRLSEEVFYGENAGKTLHKGFELMGGFRFNHEHGARWPETKLNLSVTISENTFKDFVDDGEDFGGNMIPGIPAGTFTNNISFFFRNRSFIYLYYRYSGAQFLNDSNTGKYKGYHYTAAKVGRTFKFRDKSQIEIYLGVNNILNKNYASMILINAVSFGGALPRYYYPGQPRYFYGGVKIIF